MNVFCLLYIYVYIWHLYIYILCIIYLILYVHMHTYLQVVKFDWFNLELQSIIILDQLFPQGFGMDKKFMLLHGLL